MKAHEIRERTIDDINNDILAAEENLRTLGFRLVTSQLENTSAIKKAKKDLARLKTVLREHELGIRTLYKADAGGGEEKK
ncbi:50S ribosomal protein L29 [Candidatus Latescibacterota bacterium]